MPTMKICKILPLLMAIALPSAAQSEPIAKGKGKLVIEIDGRQIEIFTYRPATYSDGPLIVACHGVLRNAEEYSAFTQDLADQLGALVVAPHFDDERFPEEAYQFGGIRQNGEIKPSEQWTVSLIPKIVEAVRVREQRPTQPYFLLGHSAGGQFLARLSGVTATQADRIVIANPGSHLFPTRDQPFPYGFGGLPDGLSDDLALQRYLAQPVTIYLGTADTGSESLPQNEHAQRQGATRYERGNNCYRAAAELAAVKGWKFNWTLIRADEIGHSAEAMFQHPIITQALLGDDESESVATEMFDDEFEILEADEVPG
jgi:poly(3-hydroxybutyrate) depolymerase